MRRGVALLWALGMMGAACGARPAAALSDAPVSPTAVAPESPEMVQWLPWESWPGGRQYDPRLDKEVRFWGAGMPLREVFAGVQDQTGVEIGFWPPGDGTERVCVNLYLNPEKPPTLRELMAQLTWVMDCTFGCSGESAETRYALVRKSLAADPIEDLKQHARHVREQREQYCRQIAREMYREVLSRLDQFEEALALAPEVVASRYAGSDDLLVLAMSSPEMRAAVQFLGSLPERDLTSAPRSFHLDYAVSDSAWACRVFTRDWKYMSPEQRALLRTTLEPTLERSRREWNARVPPEYRCPEVVWTDDLDLRVEVNFTDVGGFRFGAYVTDQESAYYARGLGADGPFLAVVPPPDAGMLAGDTTIALRRAAGEHVAAEDEYWIQDAFKTALQRRELRRETQRRLAEQEHLSATGSQVLGSLPLPLDLHEPYALWQIQEAVAARTGLHVVSDCLCQLPRRLDQAAEVLYTEEPPELTALTVLRLSCTGLEGREAFADAFPAPRSSPGWEWGDAGTFLRFRSAERDLWRAGFLPDDMLATVDEWLAPYLPQIPEAVDSRQEITVPVDLREMGRWAGRLTEPQRRWGGVLIYDDPASPLNACRNAFREHVFIDIAIEGDLLAQLAMLRQDQWERLGGEGMRWGTDFSPRPGAEADVWTRWLGAEEGDVIRLAVPEPVVGPSSEEGDGRDRVRLEVVRDGSVVKWNELRTAIRLWPRTVTRLTGEREEATDP